MKRIKELADKIPHALPARLMLLITTIYLIIIGIYLPTVGIKQLIMKLGIMGMGLFASWKLLVFMRPARKEHGAGKDS
ncbi:MAG: hypothetical protein ACI8XU_002514 [Kiritimatiellia bacterium]|jgi:hypothetical protein